MEKLRSRYRTIVSIIFLLIFSISSFFAIAQNIQSDVNLLFEDKLSIIFLLDKYKNNQERLRLINEIGKHNQQALPILQRLYFTDSTAKNLVFDAVCRIVKEDPKNSRESVPILMHSLQDNQFLTIRIQAAKTLGSIGYDAKSAIRDLTECMESSNIEFRNTAAIAIKSIAIDIMDKSNSMKLREKETVLLDLQDAYKVSDTIYLSSNEREEIVVPIRIACKHLELLIEKEKQSIWESFKNILHKYPFLIPFCLYIIFAILFWSLLFVISPFSIIKLYSYFSPNEFIPIWKNSKISVRKAFQLFSFCFLFLYNPRVLNAWVLKHINKAKEQFEKVLEKRDQSLRISLPIFIDGVFNSAPSSKDFQEIFSQNSIRLLIYGEGGVGKTNLACQIGRWAMEKQKRQRLCLKHNMIPILIDQEIDYDEKNKDVFNDVIRGKLKEYIQTEIAIDKELTSKLLTKRRILVIVDSYSEMSLKTCSLIKPDSPNFPVNALIVTSRLEKTLAGDIINKTEPCRLKSVELVAFERDYIKSKGKKAFFDEDENDLLESSLSLKKITRGRDIPVLLAKLYVDQLILFKDGTSTDELPKTVPALMLQYLNELNRKIQFDTQPDREVYRATGTVAWECIKEKFAPIAISCNKAEEILIQEFEKNKAKSLFDLLLERHQIIKWDGEDRSRIRFTIDTLAEYLAAHIIVNSSKKTQELLDSISMKLRDHKKYHKEQIEGFWRALEESADIWSDTLSREILSARFNEIIIE